MKKDVFDNPKCVQTIESLIDSTYKKEPALNKGCTVILNNTAVPCTVTQLTDKADVVEVQVDSQIVMSNKVYFVADPRGELFHFKRDKGMWRCVQLKEDTGRWILTHEDYEVVFSKKLFIGVPTLAE